MTLEPPVITPDWEVSRRAKFVAVALIIAGSADLIVDIATLYLSFQLLWNSGGDVRISVPLGFLTYWAVAFFIWKGAKVIWPILFYGSVLTFMSLALGTLGCLVLLPWKLISALWHTYPSWANFYACYLAALTALSGWIWFESNRFCYRWKYGLPKARWLRPVPIAVCWALLGLGALWGFVALLSGGWTAEARLRAREELGAGYDYQVLTYNFSIRNGVTAHQAVVLAYTDRDLRRLNLRW